jgi:pyruvate formate lyase activating enzyme
VRKRQNDQIVLDTYGRSSGFCIDPIEKKPLNHFFPGTPVLSFGTAGCNLACKFCQNHDISKSRDQDALMHHASPEQIVDIAHQYGCSSVAYTYNDPVIFLEYAVDIAAACRAQNIKNIAVTAGYICDAPREEFFRAMDATNIDLKGFTDRFYKKVTGSEIQPVLETIAYVVQETSCWVELTTLLIPGENDDPKELEALSRWVLDTCGADTPLHFTAFHPDFRMLSTPATPPGTVLRARQIALDCGLQHVYVGNIKNFVAQSSYCTGCGVCVIGRDWHIISTWELDDFGDCSICGTKFVGYTSGEPGDWGRKRLPISV